jgi:hypothetical protein
MPVDQVLLRERLAAHDLPMGQYAVYGDAALAARGLITADRIDLIVAPRLFDELRERGWTELPGTDGHVLVAGDLIASQRTRWTSHLSTIDLVGDVDQVAGLPVVKLPILRKHIAAQGSSDAVIWRLSLIDHALGVRTPAAVRGGARPPSGTGGAYPLGIVTAPAPPPSVVPSKRPGTLTAAGVITIVMSSIALLGFGPLALIILGDRAEFENNIARYARDPDYDLSDVVTVLGVVSLVAALMSLTAVVLGALLLRNKRVRIALVVLSSIALLMSFFAVLTGAFLGLLWVIAAILVIVFCFVGGAGTWFDAQSYAAYRARQQHDNLLST